MAVMLTLAKNCAKVGIPGGAIYWSVQQGVWGTPEEGSQAMKRFMSSIMPETNGQQPVVSVPKPSDNIFLSSWNQGAKTVFEVIRDAPEYTGKAKAAVSKLVGDNLGK